MYGFNCLFLAGWLYVSYNKRTAFAANGCGIAIRSAFGMNQSVTTFNATLTDGPASLNTSW